MADAIREGDFVEVEYTGKIVGDNAVFDTTFEETARKSGIYDEHSKYGPVRICVGKRHVIAGLDQSIVGRNLNSKYTVRISPKDAFGEKNARMIQLIATNKFRQQGIAPMPGLRVNMDGVMGTIKTVSGGRTIVDFNHPLAGKELEYEITATRIVTDVREKVAALLEVLGVMMDSEIVADKLTLKTDADLSKEVQETLIKAITESVREIKTVVFEKKAAEKNGETAKEIAKQ
jgi:FKBP-type peptidyl-prolyl cis-trans isomerase 2